MPIDRIWLARAAAAAGFVLAAAGGGVVLSSSAPALPVANGVIAGAVPSPSPLVADPTTARTVAAPAPAPTTALTPALAPALSAAPAERMAGSTMGAKTPAATGEQSASAATLSPAPAGGFDGPPAIAPSPVIRVQIPAIRVDAVVKPVDSQPTGARNAWGGEIFAPIEFPVDQYVRQWVRRGDPNTVPPTEAASNVKAFDRTVLYGHASDIGNHLVFQDLAALKPGDAVIVETALGRFEYRVTVVLSHAKSQLDGFATLYQYPTGGAKELALVACLPDTTSNVVVFADLASAQPHV